MDIYFYSLEKSKNPLKKWDLYYFLSEKGQKMDKNETKTLKKASFGA